MVLLWMILLEVLLCAQAENGTEVRGQLGSEVTLTCSNQSSDAHWYMELYNQLRVYIGRSLSSAGSSFYTPGFEAKFSMVGNTLKVKNLTAEDCRLYYCGRKREGNIQIVETFHLVSDVALHTNNPQNHCGFTQLIIIVVCASAAAVVAVVLGAVVTVQLLKRKSKRNQWNNTSVHIYENAAVLRAAQGKAIRSQPAKQH